MDTQTRHALKQDRFVSATTSGLDWVGEHRSTVLRWSAALVVLIAVVIVAIVVHHNRVAAADQLLGQAMDIYQTPLTQPGQPAEPGQKTYPTAAARAKEANPLFRQIANQYSWLRPGTMARYFAGLTELDLNQQSAAEADLQKASDAHDHNLAALAKLALANVYQQSGRSSQAVSLFQDLIQHPTTTVPKTEAQLDLAQLYETTQPQEARRLYAQIKDEDKTGQAGQIATQKLQTLR